MMGEAVILYVFGPIVLYFILKDVFGSVFDWAARRDYRLEMKRREKEEQNKK
jgi:hypothetical protein